MWGWTRLGRRREFVWHVFPTGGRVLCGYCVFPTGVGAARATAQTYQKQDAPDAWPLKTWLLNHLIIGSKLDHDSAGQNSL